MTWILLGIAYVLLFLFCGLYALRKGHTILFFVGFLLPLLWIVGAILPPTSAATTAQSRANLR